MSICEGNKPKFQYFFRQNLRKGEKKKPESDEEPESDEKQEEESKVTNNYVGIHNSVLLQTAQVGLLDPNAAGEGVQVRLVFDGGAREFNF